MCVGALANFAAGRRPAACDCAYAHMENYAACALQFACCGAGRRTGRSTGRSTQIAARRPHGFLCVSVRTSNSSYVHKHEARKWNCWKFRCAISGNTEKVEISSTRCGLRQSMNQSSQLTHSTFCAACGLRQSMNRP